MGVLWSVDWRWRVGVLHGSRHAPPTGLLEGLQLCRGELNLLRDSTIEGCSLMEEVPEKFVFSVRAHKSITHEPERESLGL